MDARIINLEQQLHDVTLQQRALKSLLARLVSHIPSLGWDSNKTLNTLESALSSLHEDKPAFQVEHTPPRTPQPAENLDQLESPPFDLNEDKAAFQVEEIKLTPPRTPQPAENLDPLESPFLNLNEDKATFQVEEIKVEDIKVEEIKLTSPRTPQPAENLDELASVILNIIHQYGQHVYSAPEGDSAPQWLGKSLFMDRVKEQISKDQTVRMILPAFPWKSVNKVDKVTGVLPDLGEELALHRLNQLCEDIKTVYAPGGQVYIATDGLVFDDVVGISDEDSWAYSEGLVDMARQQGLHNVKLLRVMDILGWTEGKTLDKELYLSLTQKCREELLARYCQPEEKVREMMKEDADTLSTYCGFIRFLEADLRFSPITASSKAISGSQYRKTVKKVAIQMMVRAESFTKLLKAHCPEFVRLSIHPSTGAVKLSIPLIVQGSGGFPRSPWHSSTAIAVDGSYSTVHKRDVAETHDLVCDHRSGRPYYFREKSDLWRVIDEDEEIVCQPVYQNRLVIRPAREALVGVKRLSALQLEDLDKLKAAHTAGPVEFVGFATDC